MVVEVEVEEGWRGVGGPEGGTSLHSLQEYFFFDSFKMSVIKRAIKRKEEKNFDQTREEKEKVLSNFIFF